MSAPYKAISTGATLVAGLVARQALGSVWKISTGRRPPDTTRNPDSNWPEAFTWAVVSSATLAVAQLFAARKAASYYRRSTGHLPGDMAQELSAERPDQRPAKLGAGA